MTDTHWADILHIYGQQAWHDEVNISGGREALTALRDAITSALANSNGMAGQANVFVNDGEGYNVFVYCVTDEEANVLPVPYTADYAKHRS